jgi:hypothetical protein
MTSQDKLIGEDAELLLYLANELEPPQRVAFEARLQESSALRQQLTDLRGVDETLSVGTKLSASSAYVSERALKSSLRVVREQMMVHHQRLGVAQPFRVPRYAIAAAIAVVFTLGFIGWLYTTPPVTPSSPAFSNRTALPSNTPANPGFALGGGFSSAFLPIGVDQYGESSREIDQQLDALSMLSDFEESESN